MTALEMVDALEQAIEEDIRGFQEASGLRVCSVTIFDTERPYLKITVGTAMERRENER